MEDHTGSCKGRAKWHKLQISNGMVVEGECPCCSRPPSCPVCSKRPQNQRPLQECPGCHIRLCYLSFLQKWERRKALLTLLTVSRLSCLRNLATGSWAMKGGGKTTKQLFVTCGSVCGHVLHGYLFTVLCCCNNPGCLTMGRSSQSCFSSHMDPFLDLCCMWPHMFSVCFVPQAQVLPG